MSEVNERRPPVGFFDVPLGAVVDAAREAILITDSERTIVAVNAAALAMFGYTQPEVVGQRLDRLIPQRLRGAHAGPLRAFEAAGKGQIRIGDRMPVRGLRKDGTEFPAEVAMSRVELAGPDNGRTCFITMLCDLSPWRAVLGPLDETAQRFRDLLDLAPVAMWITEGERVSFANRAAHQLFGGGPGLHLVGQSVPALIRADSRDAMRAHIDRVLRGEPDVPVVHGHIVRPDGVSRDVEITSTALPDHGRTVLQMVITDVTQRQQQERDDKRHRSELRQLSANVVEAREEERRRIARELHDELGQRLSALKMGLSGLRSGGVARGAAGRVDEMLEMIDDTVAALRRIAADLRPLMLDDLGLNAAIEALAREASHRMDVEVAVRLGDEDPPLADGAAIAVYRMVQEALTNVGRHARATEVRIELLRQGDEIVLTVRDNGVGFAAEAQPTDGRYGLLGIRERALMLGGRLEVDNPPGGGARVTVHLPLKPPAAEAAPRS